MLNKYPNLRTPLSSFVNQRNMHNTLPRYLYNITVGYTSLLNTFFCWLEQQILQLPLCAIIWVTQNSISFFPFIGLLCKIASVLYLCCMAKCQPHNMCLIDLEMCPVYRDMKILIEVCSGYLSVLSVKPSILLYPAEFIKVFLVLIILTCLTQWFYLNCRQILKILGFFSEPQQAPISFVPATLQTADATSSRPGATLMWVRRCSTNRALTDLCRQEWYGLGMEHGGRLLSIRHAAILWWQVARSASLGDVDNKEKIIVWSEVQCLCRRAWFYELKSIQVV